MLECKLYCLPKLDFFLVGGFISKVHVLKVEASDFGMSPSLFREKFWVLRPLPIMGHHTKGGIYGEIMSQNFLTALMVSSHLPNVYYHSAILYIL